MVAHSPHVSSNVRAALVTALLLLTGFLSPGPHDPAHAQAPAARPSRIVSLIPATTEMLFAMGAGDRLVGVGTYDRFPADVARLPRVGGLIDPDTERILALRPDLVIVYNTQVELKQRLDRARLPYFSYEHRALPDIMNTVRVLGERVGAGERAHAVADEMDHALAAVSASVAGRTRPRALLVFGRQPGTLRSVNASGGYGFLADLLNIAGAENVFNDITQQSVQASTEMILARRPDVIVELKYGAAAPGLDVARELEPWKALASVPAVRTKRLYLLTGDEFVVPGPRIVLAAQRLARALHP
jgi:iron complex transport system substrate-binding protein